MYVAILMVVTNSLLSTSDTAMGRLRSDLLTLTDGNEYRAETGKDPASSGEIIAASIVAVPD